jgi:sn-glycerol 3-phosphate transport system permease protein
MTLKRALAHLPPLFAAALMLFPLVWMVSTAWKTPDQVFSGTFNLWPSPFTTANYEAAMTKLPLARWYLNSGIVTGASVVGSVVTSLLAGYAFARFTFAGREVIFYAFLGTMLVPIHVVMIPNYLLLADVGWLNSYQAIVIPHLASGFGIFLFRQHIRALPANLLEAAEIDGAGTWQALWLVVVPNIQPVIATLGVLFFIGTWNEYVWPLLVIKDRLMMTLPVGIQAFVSLEGGSQWGPFMAAVSLVVLPALAMYLLAQRRLVETMLTSGMNG